MTVRQFKITLLSIAAALAAVGGLSFLSDWTTKNMVLNERELKILRSSLAFNLHLRSARDVLASACGRYYADSDPVTEARHVVQKSPYIYFAFHYDDVDAGMNAPGFDRQCTYINIDNVTYDPKQKGLDYFNSIDWYDAKDQNRKSECIDGAYEYGKRFNEEVRRVDPAFFKLACHASDTNRHP